MACAVFGARPNSHPFQERKVTLKEPCKVGRAVAKCKPSQTNLIFDCKVLSRSHAIIWHENGKFLIQDTKSSNGTYVNSVQVGRNADDSEIVELRSGDVVQFGVDVTENSKKVTHGCIIAMVTLINADGTEALGEPEKPVGRVLPFVDGDQNMKAKELWQLSKYIQDAMNREQLLEQKLATMQRMIANSSTSSDEAFQAFVKEDELLSRLDILENELDIITKDLPEDDNRKLLISFQADKETYESKAKESIQRLVEEKSDVLQKLADVQRSLSYSEDECAHLRSLFEKSEEDIRDLMDRNEQLMKEVKMSKEQLEKVESKQKRDEEQINEERKKLKVDKEIAEKRASTLAVQVESLQAECDFTKEQLSAMKEKFEKQNGVAKRSEENSLEKSDQDVSLHSTSLGLAYENILLEIKKNLLEMKKHVKTLSPGSSDEDAENTDIDSSGILGVDGELDLAGSLEYFSNISRQINDDLVFAGVNMAKINDDEERELRHQLQSAETEVFQVQLQIDELNENLLMEQQASQKYKELATEFEGRLKQLQERMDKEEEDKISKQEQSNDQSRIEKIVDEFLSESVVHQLESENNSIEEIATPRTLEEVPLEQSMNSSDAGTVIGTKEENDEGDGTPKDRELEYKSKSASQESQTMYLLFALVAIIVAIGAAYMLDVINVSMGKSPIFDRKTWRELYEQFF